MENIPPACIASRNPDKYTQCARMYMCAHMAIVIAELGLAPLIIRETLFLICTLKRSKTSSRYGEIEKETLSSMM